MYTETLKYMIMNREANMQPLSELFIRLNILFSESKDVPCTGKDVSMHY